MGKQIDVMNEYIGRIFSVCTFIIMIIVICDVSARAFFERPIDWAFAVSTQLYALLFMILGAYTLLHNAHVNVDILVAKLSGRTRALIDTITYLVFFFPFVSVLIYFGYRFAHRSWASGETTWGVVAIPVYPIKSVIFVTGCLLFLQGIVQFTRTLRALRGK